MKMVTTDCSCDMHIIVLCSSVPSGAPMITEDVMITPTEIEVSWTEVDPIDQNGIITVYEVDYQPLQRFNDSDDITAVNTSDTNITLTNLHESVQYNITVRAFTSVGPGPFSAHVLSITEEAGEFNGCIYQCKSHLCSLLTVPASPPDNVRAISVSSTEIMVTWDIVPLIDQNGVIPMYEVLYQPQETFDGSIGDLTVNVSAPEMSVVLMDLEEYVNYTISVRAYTSVGEGPYSDGIIELTNEDSEYKMCKRIIC